MSGNIMWKKSNDDPREESITENPDEELINGV